MSDKLTLELKETPEPLKMKLSSNTHRGVTLDGLPVYVVDALPDNPEVGNIVALNKTAVKPWDKVKVWSRDEVPYKEEGAVAMCEGLPFEVSFVAGAVPESFDLSGMDKNGYFASGVILQGSNGALDISMDNVRTNDRNDVYVIIHDHYKDSRYIFNKGVWQAQQKDSGPTNISAQDIKLPNLSDVVVLDYFCLLTDDEVMEYESIGDIEPEPALSILSQLGTLSHETGFYIAEESGDGSIWQRLDKKTVKQLSNMNAQTADSAVKASTALTRASEALSRAVNAQNLADINSEQIRSINSAIGNLNNAYEGLSQSIVTTERTAQDAYSQANTAQNTANTAKSQAETNANAIAELQTAVNGYSTFLEEINGEVVEDE